MTVFIIPDDRLRHFLLIMQMNFDLKEPKYIFQVKDTFQIVMYQPIEPYIVSALENTADQWFKERDKK